MKNKLIIALGALFLSLNIVASANPVEKKTKKGKTINLEIVSEGAVVLYKVEAEVLKATIPEDPMESYTHTETTYYVCNAKDESVKKITMTNYKKLLTSHMTGNSEVSEKIGSKGYKFVNVEGIFMAYNSI